MTRRSVLYATAVSLIALAPHAGAQGTLSTQGFGYPAGQLSTRALATGGGVGHFDAHTPINPASISVSGDALLFMQYEPEFRRVEVSGGAASTRIARFPVAVAALPIGSTWVVGLSVSTLLDRSGTVTTTRDDTVAGEQVTITESIRTLGAINDARLAVSWAPSRRMQFGLGGHVFPGNNRVTFTQSFPDTSRFGSVSENTTIEYSGFAASAGVILRPSRILALSLTGRKGGDLNARRSDTVVSEARVPDRIAAAATYDGITGASLSAHVTRDSWSSLNGLGSEDATAADTWDMGGGVEALGPRIGERVIVFRAGTRYRTLPFLVGGAGGTEVKELAFAGGLGTQFRRNRAAVDFALQYARRSASTSTADPRERAITLSFGLRVTP